MTIRSCVCGTTTLGNTGTTNCQPLMKAASKIIMVPTFTSAGVRNKHLITTVITQGVLDALINNSDANLRWFPSPLTENLGGERADSQFETSAGGTRAKTADGIRNQTFEIWGQGPEYKYQLDSARCTDWSLYIVDTEGNLIGMELTTPDGYLYPIRVDKNSFDAKWVMPTETTIGKIAVSFDWHKSEDDAQMRMIANGDITADLLNSEGLLDISVTYGTITTTTVKINLFERYGSRVKKNKLKGLVTADFISSVTATASKLRNLTDSADIALSSAVEETGTETATAGPGTYLLTFTPAQTSTDVMILKFLKTGFDATDVVANTFAIP